MKTILTISLLLLTVSGALAQDNNRFTLEKTANGYVRMDRSTGEMSICKEQADQLVCRVAADDRAALEDSASQLETRVLRLEEKFGQIEKSGAMDQNTLPTDEEVEKTFGYMEKFFRRFMGVVKDLNVDENQLNKT